MGKSTLKKYRKRLLFFSGITLLLTYALILPSPLFKDPVSTVLLAEDRSFLGARIASDGQWRFPELDTLPINFVQAITTFEDKRFMYHPGVDFLAFGRALYQNISSGRVISGGSTLSMQVIRLVRKGKPRTLGEKMIEIVLATRLELKYSKKKILSLYASHAPFGGNVVGLEAAAWKYYGRKPSQLSWAEASTLAVLPNAPSLIHPGRNRNQLQVKRDRLLEKLRDRQIIDSLTCLLAQAEKLPEVPLPLPSHAPHLLEYHRTKADPVSQGPTQSTLDRTLQIRAGNIVQRYYRNLIKNGVHNAAALIVEVETGDIKAYIGNTRSETSGDHGHAVDLLTAPRSSGSILKPFLYASMLDEGHLLPQALIPDIPSFFQGYAPGNYNNEYLGAVPAHLALARSLNVPAVRMLRDFGIPKFQQKLEDLGMTTLHRQPHEYGLTLVLGGAEANMKDICSIYAAMARSLTHFYRYEGAYNPTSYRTLNYIHSRSEGPLPPEQYDKLHPVGKLSAAAIWHTFEAMVEVTRPSTEKYWQSFGSSQQIAWKTGTSFGNRDAWAVGLTPEYVIGVWVGNADGEGRPGLTGISTAAPILFDLFNIVPSQDHWFEPPYSEMYQADLCKISGFLASPHCPSQTDWIPKQGEQSRACPFHKQVWIDTSQTYQVHASCESPTHRKAVSWFVLPPIQEHYYDKRNPTYSPLPPWRSDCLAAQDRSTPSMQLIYPQHRAKIYVPTELDGSPGRTVFEITHRNPTAKVHWHVDRTYVGSTEEFHEMALYPDAGRHTLTLVDQWGEFLEREFEILNKN